MIRRGPRAQPLRVAALILGLAAPGAQALPPNALLPTESPPRFVEADAAFAERADPERALFALEACRKRLAEAPDDWEAGWRLAVAAYHVGNRVLKDQKEREQLWAEGRDAARHAASLQESCVPCHFWAAVDMALYGQSVGVVRMLFTLSEIRRRLELVLELDPGYAYAGAPRSLAMIEDGLPAIFGGSDKRAEEYFRQAIALAPEEPLNFEFYAAFLEEKGRLDEALSLVERGLATPPPTPERVESIDSIRTLNRMKPRIEAKLAEKGGEKKKKGRWPFRR